MNRRGFFATLLAAPAAALIALKAKGEKPTRFVVGPTRPGKRGQFVSIDTGGRLRPAEAGEFPVGVVAEATTENHLVITIRTVGADEAMAKIQGVHEALLRARAVGA